VRKGSVEGTEVVVKYVELVRRKGFLSTKMVEEEKQTTIFFPKVSIANINDIKEVNQSWNKVMDSPGKSFYHHLDYGSEWNSSEWGDILKTGDETTGEVWVRGYTQYPHGIGYYAKFYCPDLYNRVKHEWEEFLQQLKLREFEKRKSNLEYLEEVGRYEEAAQIYEYLDMPEKAGEMRRKKRETSVVRVDLNDLIRQLGERGFTITYHCSHCGAPLKIGAETEVEAIKFCSHCGSRLEAIDLARFIKSHLS